MDIREERKNIYNIILAGVFAAYLVFNGMLLIRHELWRDEANVWLIARELSPVQLFAEIRYQGHPCLWYLLVMPLAKLGLPFQLIGVLSLAIMGTATGLFLWKAPFHIAVKSICVFSPMFTYFYACIARNYCLVALFLLLLAQNYHERNERCISYGLLLGLLVQADTIALAPAGMISLIWLWENCREALRTKCIEPLRRIIKGIWIPLVSLLLWMAQFWQVSDSPAFQISELGKGELFREVRNYSLWILERMSGRGRIFCVIYLIVMFVLLAILALKVKRLGAVWVMAASWLFEAVFSVVVYQLHLWHFISLCFVLIWTIWILETERKREKTADNISIMTTAGLEGLLLVLSICMFLQWSSREETSSLDNALHGRYSDGVYTAEFIEKNISADEVIISANVSMASTVLAYLPGYRFYFAGTGQITTYADYGKAQDSQIGFEELRAWGQENFPEKKEIYLLDTEDSCIIEKGGLKECEVLYQTRQETARGEEYTVYRIPLQADSVP